MPGRPAPPPVPVPRRAIVAAPRGPAPGIPDETPTDPGRPEPDLESLDVIPAAGEGEVAIAGSVELEPTRPPTQPPPRPGPVSLGPGPTSPPDRRDPPSFGSGGGLPAAPLLADSAPASPEEATDPFASSAGMAPLSVPPAPSPLAPPPPVPAPPPPAPAPVGRPSVAQAPVGPAPATSTASPASDLAYDDDEEDEEGGGGVIRLLIRALGLLVILLAIAFIGLHLAVRQGWLEMPAALNLDGSSEVAVDPPRLEPPTAAAKPPLDEPTTAAAEGEAVAVLEGSDPLEPDPTLEPAPTFEAEPTPFEREEPPTERGSRAAPPDWDPDPEPTASEPATRRPDPEPTASNLPDRSVSLSVSHRPLTSGSSGASDLVSVRIEGAPRDTAVTLHFGPADGPHRTTKLRARSGGRWEGWLSFDAAAGEQIEYWIVATHPAADGPASAGSSSQPFVVQVK